MDKIQLLGLMLEAADDLDRSGLLKEADTITCIMEKVAQATISMQVAATNMQGRPALYQEILSSGGDGQKIMGALQRAGLKGLMSMANATIFYQAATNMQKQVKRPAVQPVRKASVVVANDDAMTEAKENEIKKDNVKCKNCGESWDKETPGHAEASEAIKSKKNCPACEGKE